MIGFDYNGIKIEATIEMQKREYRDVKMGFKTHFEKRIMVAVSFWDFIIPYGDLQELAHIKSSLQYFMHCYWKRNSRDCQKIELAKSIHHDHQAASLYFVARQKNKEHSLQISLQKAGKTVEEIYLDGHEVIMLDIAIGKAINLLSPFPNRIE